MSATKGRLLLKIPVVFEEAVLFNLSNREEEVYLKLLESIEQKEDVEDYRHMLIFLEEWHKEHKKHPFMYSNGCGCGYCLKTREYANLKLNIHRRRSMLDNCFSLYPSERYKAECEYLYQLEARLKELIEERKTMRIHLGFISKRVLK